MKRVILLAALMLLAPVACVTERQVKDIVATSNAAMVDVPDLAQPGDEPDPERLKQAVARIEALINAHPDQTVLVNTLRVRQAMMLTVHKQFEAAKVAWGKASTPPGQRDAALHERWKDIVWWFEKATTFLDEDIVRGKAALENLDGTCDKLPEKSEVRYYLETMRAMIALQVANKTNTLAGGEVKAKTEQLMAGALQRLAARFDEQDAAWIKSKWDVDDPDDIPIVVLRARVWMRTAMRGYFKVAKTKNMNPDWAPDWVAERAAALTQANPPPGP